MITVITVNTPQRKKKVWRMKGKADTAPGTKRKYYIHLEEQEY